MKNENSILYLLNEEESAKKPDKHNTSNTVNNDDKQITKPEGYNPDIDPISTFSIYIKTLEKVINLLNDSIVIVKEINNIKLSNNIKDEETDKAIQNKIKLTDIVSNIEVIVSEFIKAFSIITEPQKKELFEYLHNQFNNVDFNIKFFFVRHEMKYAENALKVCHSLIEIFKRFKDTLNTANNSDKHQNVNDKETIQNTHPDVIMKKTLGKDI